ncbi:hypothetical protein OH809_07580 [Streptomyces sp. NBC_00873]|uniref:hypothetical protein n=1 Tax=unclassified Streptomyces TaxID=2593676 RepID=UPI0038665A37|nr:hypothetical protein OH809_07580 [Streptomyces sp. NBC_00873]WTA47395.1 hypothetical protein OH821_36225 [Streptomyces sp. NBC_00842]
MRTLNLRCERSGAQTAWYATYQELADTSPAHDTATHRRRLQELSRRIAGHPYWQTAAGTPAAWMALKKLARAKAQS